MKRTLLTMFTTVVIAFGCLTPATASADILSVWARGDSLALQGGDGLTWFENNKGVPAFGFGLGIEVLFIDVFVDANFFTDGAQWNQFGLGFDINVVPVGPVTVSPTIQAMYFFAKQSNDDPANNGLHGRAGLVVGVPFAKVLSFNLEGFVGYVLELPDVNTALTYSGGANLTFTFGI